MKFKGVCFIYEFTKIWEMENGDMYFRRVITKGNKMIFTPFIYSNNQFYKVTNYPEKFNTFLNKDEMSLELHRHLETIKSLIGKDIKLDKYNAEFINVDTTPNNRNTTLTPSYEKAIKSLEEEGITNPTVPEILERMGFTVYNIVGWFNESKGLSQQDTIFKKENSNKNNPKYRECFMNAEFWCILSSSKRAVFTNGKLYVVDSPIYGHALYIFKDYNSAKDWAKNLISFKEARIKSLVRVTHHDGWQEKIKEILK